MVIVPCCFVTGSVNGTVISLGSNLTTNPPERVLTEPLIAASNVTSPSKVGVTNVSNNEKAVYNCEVGDHVLALSVPKFP